MHTRRIQRARGGQPLQPLVAENKACTNKITFKTVQRLLEILKTFQDMTIKHLRFRLVK